MAAKRAEVFLDFASTYSALAAWRGPAAAKAAGVELVWKPMLLEPIFSKAGHKTSPILASPGKTAHMWRDLQRLSASLGIAYRRPSVFPQRSILAGRVGIVAAREDWFPGFADKLYRAQFAEGLDIGDRATVEEAIRAAGKDPAAVVADAESQPVKDALKANTDEAEALGIFGAPMWVVRGAKDELFWGADRMDEALRWAAKGPWC